MSSGGVGVTEGLTGGGTLHRRGEHVTGGRWQGRKAAGRRRRRVVATVRCPIQRGCRLEARGWVRQRGVCVSVPVYAWSTAGPVDPTAPRGVAPTAAGKPARCGGGSGRGPDRHAGARERCVLWAGGFCQHWLRNIESAAAWMGIRAHDRRSAACLPQAHLLVRAFFRALTAENVRATVRGHRNAAAADLLQQVEDAMDMDVDMDAGGGGGGGVDDDDAMMDAMEEMEDAGEERGFDEGEPRRQSQSQQPSQSQRSAAWGDATGGDDVSGGGGDSGGAYGDDGYESPGYGGAADGGGDDGGDDFVSAVRRGLRA